MTWLSTGSALLFALVAVWAAWDARAYAARVEFQANRLRGALGRLSGLEAATENQLAQLQKLRGQFYAAKASGDFTREDGVKLAEPVPECENWRAAQVDGPLSAAARCECSYCSAKRDERARVRAAIKAARAPAK